MVIFDSNFVLTLLSEVKIGPTDPSTGSPLTYHEQRVQALFDALEAANEVIGIPTPVVAEIGIKTDRSTQQLVSIFSSSSRFRFLEFDVRAAIECADLAREGDVAGNKRYDSNPGESWAKVKFDRQIFSIAKVHQAECVFTWDRHLANICNRHGIKTVSIFELPVPDSARQMELEIAVDTSKLDNQAGTQEVEVQHKPEDS